MPDQPLLILAEGAGIEGSLTHVHVQKPAEEQVVAKLLAELPLRPNAEEGNEQLGLEQPLRRDGRPTFQGVHRIKQWTQILENSVHHPLDYPDGMILRHRLLRRIQGQKLRL